MPVLVFRYDGVVLYFDEAEVLSGLLVGGVLDEGLSPSEGGVAWLLQSVVAVPDVVEDVCRGF